jgi:hypothetical protein
MIAAPAAARNDAVAAVAVLNADRLSETIHQWWSSNANGGPQKFSRIIVGF